jgi:hypothetical protein
MVTAEQRSSRLRATSTVKNILAAIAATDKPDLVVVLLSGGIS